MKESKTMSATFVVGYNCAPSASFIVIVSFGPNLFLVMKLISKVMGSAIKFSVLAERTSRMLAKPAPTYKLLLFVTMLEYSGYFMTMSIRSAS